MTYDFKKIEPKWQKKWEEKKTFQVKENSKKKKYYILEMFPYPSGAGLHIGHSLNYTIGDINARYKRMNVFNVLYPMGYDSFGLPAENAAIKAKTHPKKYTTNSIKNFILQQKALGLSYDWNKKISTCEPEYYKWNQFFFLKFLEKGLVYRKKAPINWCPKCDTVLANEQVHNGKCWRHEDTEVETKQLEQWFVKTTNYADELLDDIDNLNWPDRIKTMQKNWIGKSYGTEINFEILSQDKISNVVIVHGSPNDDKTKNKDYIPDSQKAWIGWTKRKLDKKKINCVCPQMPIPWNPKYSEWKKKFKKIHVDENSILVGTSAGGGFLVRWLGETRTKIRKLILVSPGKVGNSDRLKEFYGDKFYEDVKDFVKEKIVIYTSEDDHGYHIRGAEEYAKAFNGKFVKFGKGYGHFTSKTLVGKKFPELLDEINGSKWPIFTTRPDTIYGVTFMVVSAQHTRLMELVTPNQKKEVEKFLKKINSVNTENIEKLNKEGVFTGSYAINPATQEKVPIYAGNFVVADYGSGMVMAVPAHDQRDFLFAKKYNIPIKVVIQPNDSEIESNKLPEAYTEKGTLVNSEKFNGLDNEKAKEEITKYLEKEKLAKKVTQYKLKDWLISRQRYWGTPIPIIYCDKCGIVPAPEKELPVILPDKVEFGKGNPLATNKKFLETKCPKCNSKAKRETDTMDTFFDSSWYYLRYPDNKNNKKPFEEKNIKYWLPVDQYIGGAEHACMHLIYARFFTKALRDLGLVNFNEPFKSLFNQGMMHGSDGNKMSKSLGNVINPLDVIKKYGTDSLRMALMSFASPDKDTLWDEKVLIGSYKFLTKVSDYFQTTKIKNINNKKIESKLNKTIKVITNQIENFKYNLAIIEIRNLFNSFPEEIDKKTLEKFLKLLHPICPHITEELWEKLGNKNFISLEVWPKVEETKIDENLEKQEQLTEKLIEDINHLINLMKEKENKFENVYVYVLPNEKENYLEGIDSINKRTSYEVKIFAVNDKDKYDPENKSKKVKPGRPGIYLE